MKRVLAIDEDPVALRHVRRVLEADGLRVFAVDSAIEGLLAVRHSCLDLVLVEPYMRDFDGLECLRAIRRSSPATPVVVHSSPVRPAFHSLASIAVHLGARAVLRKPVAPVELRTVISAILAT